MLKAKLGEFWMMLGKDLQESEEVFYLCGAVSLW